MKKTVKQYIAIDSGGTKTLGVLFDEYGNVLQMLRAEGANPNAIGADAAIQVVLGVIDKLKTLASASVSGVIISWAGITAYGDAFETRLRQMTGIDALYTVTDAVPLLTGGLGDKDGACLISGTGSACFVRLNNELIRIGGWGYLLDTSSGSGFDLGRDALAAALYHIDGQGEPTLLTELIQARLGCDVSAAIPRIYEGKQAYIATFADLVFEGARHGDRICLDILHRNCEGLSRMLRAAAKKLSPPFDVVLSGGIFQNYPEYIQMLKNCAPEGLRLRVMTEPILWGCAAELLWRLGTCPDDSFKKCFIETFSLLP